MKKINKGFMYIGLATIVLLGSSPSGLAKNKMIQIKGSDTMVNLGQAWAEEFMRVKPEAIIAVTGGGSGTGIAAIIAGTCDIAQSSRAMKGKEISKVEAAGAAVKEIVVGYDGIAVVVHPSNPISELTIEQISDIFTGKVTNWAEVGGENSEILALSRERNSGTHVFFLEEVVRKGNSKGPEEFSKDALMMPSNQSIVQEVKSSEASIGYVGLGYVSKDQKIIRVAKTAGTEYVQPSLETVQSGAYPVSRPLLFYTRGDVQGDVKDYIDFVLSAEGQEIIQLLDFVPLGK